MGPVAFESFDLGPDREPAMTAAARVRAAGVRLDLVAPGSAGGPWRLMVRSHDAAVARAALETDPPGV